MDDGAAGVWRDAIVRATGRPSLLADVGLGTPGLTRALRAVIPRVVALGAGVGRDDDAKPHVLAGADALCLQRACADGALLSCVLPALPDRAAAATELARVLRPGSVVCIRQPFSGRLDGVVALRFFPTALAIAERTMPSVEDVCAAFGRAGFEFAALDVVHAPVAATPSEFAGRLALRSHRLLRDIADEEFASGLAAVREEARAAPHGPVVGHLDLLSLRLGA